MNTATVTKHSLICDTVVGMFMGGRIMKGMFSLKIRLFLGLFGKHLFKSSTQSIS